MINKAYINSLFSVIVPTFNRENSLVDTLDSVRNQSYRPIELIIIDDGSSDKTKTLIESWQKLNKLDSEFSFYYKYQTNQGASAARNNGLRICQGEYIQFLDSDDLLSPSRLAVLASEFKQNGTEFIQTGFEGFCPDCGDVIDVHYGNPQEDQLHLALKGRLWANTLRSAFTRDLIIKTGFWNEQMHCFEDYEYVIRALLAAKKNQGIQEVLASASRTGKNRISDRLKSKPGREMRVHCEEILGKEINKRNNISPTLQSEFVSRIYALGFRSNACTWFDSGKRCGELANSFNIKLNRLGKRRKIIFKLGRLGGLIYELAHQIKTLLINSPQQNTKHICK